MQDRRRLVGPCMPHHDSYVVVLPAWPSRAGDAAHTLPQTFPPHLHKRDGQQLGNCVCGAMHLLHTSPPIRPTPPPHTCTNVVADSFGMVSPTSAGRAAQPSPPPTPPPKPPTHTCTNVVADSLVMVSPTSAGRAMQLSMAGTTGSMSRLPLSLKAADILTHAAFLTCAKCNAVGC